MRYLDIYSSQIIERRKRTNELVAPFSALAFGRGVMAFTQIHQLLMQALIASVGSLSMILLSTPSFELKLDSVRRPHDVSHFQPSFHCTTPVTERPFDVQNTGKLFRSLSDTSNVIQKGR